MMSKSFVSLGMSRSGRLRSGLLLPGLVWLALLWAPAAVAALDVVATSSGTGFLVREIGADQVRLTILAPPDRDLHQLQARPTMLHAVRRADLVVATGAELEVGWLPAVIGQAANPRVLPGRPGYFEAAAQVPLLDVGGPADRAHGDVHPAGNPHVVMDPVRMAQVGTALAERLAALDPPNAKVFRSRAAAFAERVGRQVDAWRTQLADAPGVVSYHKDLVYLLDRFGLVHLGTLEPVPGVPPGAAQLRGLVTDLAGQRGVVLFASYQPAQPPKALGQSMNWPVASLPLEPPLGADGAAYLAHIGQWVGLLGAAAP